MVGKFGNVIIGLRCVAWIASCLSLQLEYGHLFGHISTTTARANNLTVTNCGRAARKGLRRAVWRRDSVHVTDKSAKHRFVHTIHARTVVQCRTRRHRHSSAARRSIMTSPSSASSRSAASISSSSSASTALANHSRAPDSSPVVSNASAYA